MANTVFDNKRQIDDLECVAIMHLHFSRATLVCANEIKKGVQLSKCFSNNGIKENLH